jgi:antitoxin (DNA-binding transcriptional repressor) of toxin-antitoxin stability system
MREVLSISEADQHLSHCLGRVELDAEIIVTRRAKAIARVCPSRPCHPCPTPSAAARRCDLAHPSFRHRQGPATGGAVPAAATRGAAPQSASQPCRRSNSKALASRPAAGETISIRLLPTTRAW